MVRKKQFRTTILIDNDAPPFDDLQFITQRGFKPTNLLRAQIKQIREREEGAPTIEGLQGAIMKMQKQIQDLFNFIDEQGLFDAYMKKQKV